MKTFLSILNILCWGILGAYCSSIGIHGTRFYIILLIVGVIDILSVVVSSLLIIIFQTYILVTQMHWHSMLDHLRQ